MFYLPAYINRVLYKSTNIAIGRNYVRKARPAVNAGLGNQLKLLGDSENIDIDDSSLDFEEYESDFMKIGRSYTDVKKEINVYKENIKHSIVKRKYFKESNHNFLTWSEKEQIRHLHQSDPVQYSIEHLSEIFPASHEVIDKILKSNWRIQDLKRIIKHDKTVEKNWSLLRKSEINLEPEYKNHLLKFSSREKLIKDEEKYFPRNQLEDQKYTFTTSSKEFSSIVESSNKYKDSQNNNSQINKNSLEDVTEVNKPLQETYVMPSDPNTKITSKHMTFTKFKQQLQKANKLTDVKLEEFNNEGNVQNTMVQLDNFPDKPIQMFGQSKNILKATESENRIADFITIPKNLWKKGQTYKVDDCFYDDDGKFLYRVPGLNTNKNTNF